MICAAKSNRFKIRAVPIPYTYDSLGRTTEENVRVDDSKSQVTGYEYNAAGYMGKQWIIIRDQDLDGHELPVSQAKSKISASYHYNALGDVIERTDGEGGVTVYERDLWGRAIHIKDAEGYCTFYTYDNSGNVTSMTNGLGKKTTYSYNNRNLLAAVIDP
jgi:YD repeat-containing protein